MTIHRICNNRPDEFYVSIGVQNTATNRWAAMDIKYAELREAVAIGHEALLIEHYYQLLEDKTYS